MHGRGPERHDDRAQDYDRRRGPSPVRAIRGMRDERDRGYDRDRGYQREREADRYDRGRDRGGLGRARSPVLKKARYGRSRSPGRRSSRSPGRGAVSRHRFGTSFFTMLQPICLNHILYCDTTVCMCHLLVCAKSVLCTRIAAMHWQSKKVQSKSLLFSILIDWGSAWLDAQPSCALCRPCISQGSSGVWPHSIAAWYCIRPAQGIFCGAFSCAEVKKVWSALARISMTSMC